MSSSEIKETKETNEVNEKENSFNVVLPSQEEEEKEEKIAVNADYSSSEEGSDDIGSETVEGNENSIGENPPASPVSSSEKILTNGSKKAKKQTYLIKVPKTHLKYGLKPKVIGEHKKILFEDAQDEDFYKERRLKNPELVIWVLLTTTKSLSYSARRMFEAGWRRNIQVLFFQTNLFDIIVSQDGFESLYYKGSKIEKLPDAVLPRIGAGIDYFSLALIRYLENGHVLVLNNHSSLMISKDKLYTLETLATHGVPIPKTLIAKFPGITSATPSESESSNYDYVYREFSFPLILKKSSGSQGKGTIKIDSKQQLEDICDMIDTKNPMIFQEFIANSTGKDIRIIVIGGKPIGAMMRIGKSGSFKSNFHQGGSCKKVELTPALEWLAIEVVKCIGLEVGGIDILIGEKNYYICEVNASPGFQGFEMATGIDVADQIMHYSYIASGFWKTQKVAARKEKNYVTIPVLKEHIMTNIPRDN